jgi:hypothetical protein
MPVFPSPRVSSGTRIGATPDGMRGEIADHAVIVASRGKQDAMVPWPSEMDRICFVEHGLGLG